MGDSSSSCPVNVHNAKQIWELIEKKMDDSDGELGDNGVGDDQGDVPLLSPD